MNLSLKEIITNFKPWYIQGLGPIDPEMNRKLPVEIETCPDDYIQLNKHFVRSEFLRLGGDQISGISTGVTCGLISSIISSNPIKNKVILTTMTIGGILGTAIPHLLAQNNLHGGLRHQEVTPNGQRIIKAYYQEYERI